MVRVILAVVAGLVGAAAVHIAAIFAIPLVADNNAWGRLARIAGIHQVARIDSLRGNGNAELGSAGKPGTHDFAFIDPAFVTAACRFSLADGPVRMVATGRIDFWSASIYSRSGDNLYSINDRSAVDGQFDLLVATLEQLTEAGTGDGREETSIPVGVDTQEGYLTLRILVDEESKRPAVDAFVRSVTCMPVAPASAKAGNASEG